MPLLLQIAASTLPHIQFVDDSISMVKLSLFTDTECVESTHREYGLR